MTDNEEINLGHYTELQIVCERCSGSVKMREADALYFVCHFGEAEGMVCKACAKSDSDRLVPARMVKSLMFDMPLDAPIIGSFSPLLDSDGSAKQETDDFWVDLGRQILEAMAMMPGKVLKQSIGSQRYKGMWVRPKWDGASVTALEIAGDTPSKQLVLNVYQKTRLSQLGFIESGSTNKIWNLELSKQEQGIDNAAAVIVHTFRYGYLLDTTDVQNVTSTLDMDLDDPKYAHMRQPKSQ